jgi:hypothetical protein
VFVTRLVCSVSMPSIFTKHEYKINVDKCVQRLLLITLQKGADNVCNMDHNENEDTSISKYLNNEKS